MTELHVQKVRVRATVQDLGRRGVAHLGVPPAGAADCSALRRANRLVGNHDNAAAIEVLLGGVTLVLSGPGRVAVVGASWTADGRSADANTAQVVDADAPVTVETNIGVYAYVAVEGGLDVAPVLGSRSTDTLSGLGPAALEAGDVLPVGGQQGNSQPFTEEVREGPLRVALGPRDDWCTDDAVRTLLAAEWTVTPSSDRTALRLSGPTLRRRTDEELPSEGMVSGAIQVPPDGQPILFLANHPTTGGYPVIAVVLTDDVDRAAQQRPGSTVRFTVADPH